MRRGCLIAGWRASCAAGADALLCSGVFAPAWFELINCNHKIHIIEVALFWSLKWLMQIPRQQEIDEWKQNSPSSYCLKSVCNWIKLFITFSGSGSPASPRVKGPYLTSIFKSYDAKDGCKRPCRRSRKTKYSVSSNRNMLDGSAWYPSKLRSTGSIRSSILPSRLLGRWIYRPPTSPWLKRKGTEIYFKFSISKCLNAKAAEL